MKNILVIGLGKVGSLVGRLLSKNFMYLNVFTLIHGILFNNRFCLRNTIVLCLFTNYIFDL